MDNINPEMRAMYEQVQVGLNAMKECQGKKTKQVEVRHTLGSQKNENELVKKELDNLEAGAGVYKLIGPALVSQDASDAHMIVEKRLDYINKEITRVDNLIQDLDRNEEEERNKIMAIQKRMQEKASQLDAKKQ